MKDNTKLILVEGIPGTGKSTIAQFIAIQLEKNGKKVKWYHECQDNHFFWNKIDSCFENNEYFFRTDEKREQFMKLNLDLWKNLVEEAKNNDQVYILDGYFFAQMANTLFRSNLSTTDILKFMSKVKDIINPLDPFLVYYRTDNPEKHTVKTWDNRAQWAKEVVTKSSENIPFVISSGLKGDEAIGFEQKTIQDMNDFVYDNLEMDKISFEITKKEYKKYKNSVLERLHLDRITYIYDETNLEKYCGNFREKDDDLVIKILNGNLVCDWGQNNMALIPIEKNILNLRSYPVYLKFHSEENNSFQKIETYGEPVFRRVGCKFKRNKGEIKNENR